MLEKVNRFLQNGMPVISPVTVLLGVTVFSFIDTYSFLVPWIFAFISFASCLGLNFKEIKHTMVNPLPVIVCLFLLQVFLPVVAYGVGNLLFNGDVDTITGLILAFAIPTGVVSLMWVSIYQGNRALTLSIILVSTLLSPLLVPLTIKVLLGTQVAIDTFGLMSGLFWMIVAPSVAGMVLTKWKKEEADKWKGTLSPFSKLGLIFVILINSSVVAPYFTKIDGKVLTLGVVVLLMAMGGYIIGLLSARLCRFDKGSAISLMINSGMRNNGAGAALAVTYFPAAVAFPVVLAILFQQVLASLSGKVASLYFTHLEEKLAAWMASWKTTQVNAKSKNL